MKKMMNTIALSLLLGGSFAGSIAPAEVPTDEELGISGMSTEELDDLVPDLSLTREQCVRGYLISCLNIYICFVTLGSVEPGVSLSDKVSVACIGKTKDENKKNHIVDRAMGRGFLGAPVQLIDESGCFISFDKRGNMKRSEKPRGREEFKGQVVNIQCVPSTAINAIHRAVFDAAEFTIRCRPGLCHPFLAIKGKRDWSFAVPLFFDSVSEGGAVDFSQCPDAYLVGAKSPCGDTMRAETILDRGMMVKNKRITAFSYSGEVAKVFFFLVSLINESE
jgi:hypothetical protein